MNEIKRQLNQQMGDTSKRVQSILKNVEQQKRTYKVPKKFAWNQVIYIGIATALTALALFFTLSNLTPSPISPKTATAPTTQNERDENREKVEQVTEQLKEEQKKLNEAINANSITVYNEGLAKDEQILKADLPILYLNSDLASATNYHYTYRQLLETTNGDIGVISYNCDEKEQCQLIFVHRDGEKTSQIAVATGSYGNIVVSPDYSSFTAIPIHVLQTEEDTTVEVTQLLIIDLATNERFIPAEYPELFETASAPITSFALTNQSITLQVAALKEFTHKAILQWQNESSRPTTEIVISLP